MSDAQLAALLAGAALLLFWIVGAHNRLQALRNQIGAAWSKVDEAQRLRADAGSALLLALAGPLAAERGALDTLRAALDAGTRAAARLGAAPVGREAAGAWLQAEAALAAGASRALALAEGVGLLAPDGAACAPAAAWREAEARLAFSRTLFNEAAAAYDTALAQFPTRLVGAMFRFAPAGRL